MANGAAPARTVQTIQRLEARARRLLSRYERALTAATRAKGQAYLLFDEAAGLERVLGGDQLNELHQARAQAAEASKSAEGGPA